MIDDENTPANQQRNLHSIYGPLFATEAHRQRIDHQRLQTEYLSQVLYNGMSLVGADPVLNALLVSTTQDGKLRAVDASGPAFHVHNGTAPVASIDMQSLRCPITARVTTLPHSSLWTQPMVKLRGGGDEPTSASHQDQSDVSRDTHLRYTRQNDRQYMGMYPWIPLLCQSPGWNVPISSGDWYEVFITSLPFDVANEFLPLFGPLQLATHWTSPLANARRDFYGKLGRDRQYLFRGTIVARINELSGIEWGEIDPQLDSRNPDTPRLMIYHLMEATEPPFNPGPSYFDSLADRAVYMRNSEIEMRHLGSRDASAKVQQQWGYAVYLVIFDSPTQC
jgi:hypothetical protein